MAQYPAVVQLSDLDGTDGFRIDGAGNLVPGGSPVAGGDINGDGFADMLIGGPTDSPYGYSSGASYVIFGHAGSFGPVFDVRDIDGSDLGVQIDGADAYDYSGISVSAAGDVNGDGFGDMIVGTYSCGCYGSAYVVFGAALFDVSVKLGDLNGSNGFAIYEAAPGENTGRAVSAAGDVNGDGFADVVVGASYASNNGPYSGSAYVVFGKGAAFDPSLDLSTLDGSNGFRIDGPAYASAGYAVSSAGDVNGDGLDDLIVGAVTEGLYAGASYVVFGKTTAFAASLDLSTLNGSDGFRIAGPGPYSYSGGAVASAGDVNGDGFADLIVGATGVGDGGASYVVFGKGSGFAPDLDLANLNGHNGFRIDAAAPGDYSGYAVASAGDVNGDGFDDLIVGSPDAAPYGAYHGATYVVFGKASGFGATLALSSLDGTNGFRIEGEAPYDAIGFHVASAGDVNGDGLSDLMISAYSASTALDRSAYVMYGRLPDVAVDRLGTAASQSLVGGDLDDRLRGARGDDALWGHGGADRLSGNQGDDTLRGGDGADRLTGAGGADLLIGGAGKDVMRGGAGDDIFAFSAGDSADAGRDRILDFAQGGDQIDLRAIDADTSQAGDQAFSFSAADRFSGTAGELIARSHGADTVVLGDTDGDGHADFALVLAGSYSLGAADFLL